MKKLFLTLAASFVASSALFAQSFNITAPGFSAESLFSSTPGFTITGMGADSARNVYYLETDGALLNPASTKLYARTATANGYASPTLLFDYGSSVFGSFVVVENGRIYFGESSAHTIRSVNLDGSSPALHGTLTNNYDLAFSGGNAFVSANPDTTFSAPNNHVYQFNLTTGLADSILNATPDFSGPLEFDATGALLYGVAKFSISGIYRYDSSAVADAAGPSEITLTPPTNRLIENGSNAYLAFDGAHALWQDDFATLTRYDLDSLAAETIGSASTVSDGIGHLDFKAGELFASVTDFGTNRSTVFGVVPEPTACLLFLVGMGAALLRRRP